MIPLTFLYDEYIDRPKFTEQKKNPFEYIVPSPTSGVGAIMLGSFQLFAMSLHSEKNSIHQFYEDENLGDFT